MRLSYEPNLTTGGIVGALMALAVYYKVLDVEAAGLWSVAIAAAIPVIQGWIARFFTTPTAKLTDAAIVDPGLHPEAIDRKAEQGRSRRKSGGPATSAGSRLPPY